MLPGCESYGTVARGYGALEGRLLAAPSQGSANRNKVTTFPFLSNT
jgi:hypothetical protein